MKFFKKVFFILIIQFNAACSISPSLFKTKQQQVRNDSNEDVLDHLESLVPDYLHTSDIERIHLTGSAKKYLEELYGRIVSHNEIFLNAEIGPEFYIIKNEIPFYFSLPRGHYFLSSGLVIKYLKNEQLFAAVLCREIVKSHRNLYLKDKVVPVGVMGTAKVLKMVRVPIEVKNLINQWSFVALRRTGLDPYAYLLWLQTQNKNNLEFSFQLGSNYLMSKEEFLFKNFISSNGIREKLYRLESLDVDREFYSFYREVRKKHEARRE